MAANIGLATELLLNNALDKDTLDNSYISNIAYCIAVLIELGIDPLYLNIRQIRRCCQGALWPAYNDLFRDG